MPAQYGEEKHILEYTQGRRGGFVVDIGAADGWVNSNSAFLLHEYGWSGILVDPLPEHAQACRERYDSFPVSVIETAVGMNIGPLKLWPGEQGTTSDDAWRERLATNHGTQYGDQIEVPCVTLTELLDANDAPNIIDFLTVDCEGMDMEVLQSLDWDRYRVDLVCVEARPTWQSLVDFMADRDLHPVAVTAGNTLFGRQR